VVPSDDMTLDEARKLFFDQAPEAEPEGTDPAAPSQDAAASETAPES